VEIGCLVARGLIDYAPGALAGDRADLASAIRGCDSLLHLRYQPTQSANPAARIEQEVELNLTPTIKLLEAAESGVEYVCFASSAMVYTPPANGATESGPVGGDVSPYALIKLAQEAGVREWSSRTARPASILRLGTVYGPGETVSRAIPNFIRAVLSGTEPVVNGRGVAPFDPIYIADVAEVLIRALALRADGTFNVGSGRGRSPVEVARLVIGLCRADSGVVEDLGAEDRGGPVCDTTRARDVLGFQASTPIEVGLTAEIAWMLGQRAS
jgi:UDP-glucose 4-epimerase